MINGLVGVAKELTNRKGGNSEMIGIDMEMPKSCFECPLKTIEMDFENEFYYYCPKIEQAIRGKKYDKQRFRKCPLKEVKELNNES